MNKILRFLNGLFDLEMSEADLVFQANGWKQKEADQYGLIWWKGRNISCAGTRIEVVR